MVQHDEALGLGDIVNAALGVSLRSLTCVTKDHALIRGDLPDVRSLFLAAPCVATCREIGQESAEAIVGAGRYQKVVW
jgi:hypothetical protein